MSTKYEGTHLLFFPKRIPIFYPETPSVLFVAIRFDLW